MNTKADGTQDGQEQVVERTTEQIAQEERDAEAGFAAGVAKVRGTAEPEDKTKVAADEPSPDKGSETQKTEAEIAAEKKAAEDAAAKATADAAAAAETQKKADEEKVWEGVPKVVRDRLEALDALPAQISKLAGHVGGFKQQLNVLSTTAKAAAEKTGAETPTTVEIEAALVDPKKWEQLQADFPEWMGPIHAELIRMRNDVATALKNVKAAPAEQVKAPDPIDTNAIVAEAEERAYVRLKHPDWKDICKTPEFKGWLDKSPEMKAKADSEKADDAIAIFDGYKAHRQKLADDEAARLKNEKRLKSAVVTVGTSEPPAKGISDEDAFNRGVKRVMKGAK